MRTDVEGFEAQVLRGIDFGRTRIDNILCESHCAEVLRPMGYRGYKLRGMPGPDTLWRRETPPPEAAASEVRVGEAGT